MSNLQNIRVSEWVDKDDMEWADAIVEIVGAEQVVEHAKGMTNEEAFIEGLRIGVLTAIAVDRHNSNHEQPGE